MTIRQLAKGTVMIAAVPCAAIAGVAAGIGEVTGANEGVREGLENASKAYSHAKGDVIGRLSPREEEPTNEENIPVKRPVKGYEEETG